ncbi:MAG: DUF4345 domain-containing protein [Rhizobiaceae bacterium]
MEMTLEWPEWPMVLGDQLSFVCAGVTAFLGLMFLFLPNVSLRMTGLQAARAEGLGAARGPMAGFLLGTGLTAILFAQPFLYLALGVCWLFTAFGRLVSILSDRGGTIYNWLFLILELALGLIPVAVFFGYVPAA